MTTFNHGKLEFTMKYTKLIAQGIQWRPDLQLLC